MLVVVLNMPEHRSFQDILFPMLFISKYYAKSYASIMDISLILVFLCCKSGEDYVRIFGSVESRGMSHAGTPFRMIAFLKLLRHALFRQVNRS